MVPGSCHCGMGAVKSATIAAWNAIGTFLTNLWSGIVESGKTVFQGLSSFFTACWQEIQAMFTAVLTAISMFFSTIWSAIQVTVVTVGTAGSGVHPGHVLRLPEVAETADRV